MKYVRMRIHSIVEGTKVNGPGYRLEYGFKDAGVIVPVVLTGQPVP